jgi:hypothetical protein
MIAWHILWLTYEVRVDPKQSCEVAFDLEEIRVLAALREQQRPRKTVYVKGVDNVHNL